MRAAANLARQFRQSGEGCSIGADEQQKRDARLRLDAALGCARAVSILMREGAGDSALLEPVRIHLEPVLVALLLTSLIAYPLLIFVWLGWKRKADDVVLSLTGEAAALYLRRFQRQEVAPDKAEAEFKRFYASWYGRRYLAFPIFVFTVVVVIATYLLGDSAYVYLRKANGLVLNEQEFFQLPRIATAALAGAYAFVCWDIISRVARRNITATDVLGAAVRLAIAIPVGYSFSALLKEDTGPFIAFAVGAFPVQTLGTVLQRIANRQLGLEIGADSAQDQVVKLSGIDQPTADRIEDADITTVAQLAYCDPVQLTMRTNLGFSYVSDIVAQALAWIYLGDRLNDIRPLGFRGAVEIGNLLSDLDTNDPAISAPAGVLLSKVAKAAKMSEEEFRNTAQEIAHDPYTEFLVKTW